MDFNTIFDNYLREHLAIAYSIAQEFESDNPNYVKSDEIPAHIIIMTEYVALLHFNLSELGEKILGSLHEFVVRLYMSLNSIVPDFSFYFDTNTFVNLMSARGLDYISCTRNHSRFPYPTDASVYSLLEKENFPIIYFSNFTIRKIMGEDYCNISNTSNDKLTCYNKMFARYDSLNKIFIQWINENKKRLLKKEKQSQNLWYILAILFSAKTFSYFFLAHFLTAFPFSLSYLGINNINISGFILLLAFDCILLVPLVYFLERSFLAKYCLNRESLKSDIKFLIILNILGYIILAVLFFDTPYKVIVNLFDSLLSISLLVLLYRTDFDSICPPEKGCKKRYMKAIVCILFFVSSVFCKNFLDYVVDTEPYYIENIAISNEDVFWDSETTLTLINDTPDDLIIRITDGKTVITEQFMAADEEYEFPLYEGKFYVVVYDGDYRGEAIKTLTTQLRDGGKRLLRLSND